VASDEALGPIGYLVVEFPEHALTGRALPHLVDVVDRGFIRILDLMFIKKEPDGSIAVVELDALASDGFDVTVFDGVSSGLLDDDERSSVGSVLEPGATAAVLIYENRWAAPFVDALRREGAELVSAGFIPLDALAAALDATEPA
jgi:hypothetical protein